MGIGNPQASNQVYWDANAGQYYTFNPYSQDSKTYLGDVLNTVNNATNKNKSIVDEMVARANAAAQNVNVPTLAQLFPSLQAPMQNNMNMQMPSYGAGRFLSPSMNTQSILNSPTT